MAPKSLAPNCVLMPPFSVSPTHWGWFQRLKNSARNWRSVPCFSPMRKFLNREMFQLSRPGPRTPLWGSFPQVPGAGAEKTEVSNHFPTVCGSAILPLMFGRLAVLETMFATFGTANPMFRGAPDIAVMIPDSCQPPRIIFSGGFWLFLSRGIRYTRLVKKLFLIS